MGKEASSVNKIKLQSISTVYQEVSSFFGQFFKASLNLLTWGTWLTIRTDNEDKRWVRKEHTKNGRDS